MRQTVYVECPHLVTKSYTRTNAYGFEEDCDPEEPCGWENPIIVTRNWRGDEPTAELEYDACGGCGNEWTPFEEEQMIEAALVKARETPLDCGDIRVD